MLVYTFAILAGLVIFFVTLLATIMGPEKTFANLVPEIYRLES